MTYKFSFDSLDVSMTGEGILITLGDTTTKEKRSAIFPWRTLVENFTDDLVVEAEGGTTLALPLDLVEIEVLSVIDSLRDLATNVDDIFAPLLYAGEDGELQIEVELDEFEDTIGETAGTA